MKKLKRIAISLVLGVMTISTPGISSIFLGVNTQTVYAANVQAKTGTLSQVKATLNGKPIVFQAYNIDGYNFVRAREFMNQLNMDVQPIQDSYIGVGVQIYPDKKASNLTKLPKLTASQISVSLQKSYAYYTYGVGIAETNSFLYQDRSYFKLADFSTASDAAMKEMTQYVTTNKNVTATNIATLLENATPTGIKIVWNDTTSIVEITTYKTDLQKIYNDTHISKPETPKPTIPETPKDFKPQELTSAPKEGAILANILVDKNKSGYNSDGIQDMSNMRESYNKYNVGAPFGQCTWYAFGRFHEATGVRYPAAVSIYDIPALAKSVTEDFTEFKVSTDAKQIKNNSIGIFDSHVVFIEYVEKDKNGVPTFVYYSDSNAGGNDKYLPTDGIIKKVSFNDFKTLNGKAIFMASFMLK